MIARQFSLAPGGEWTVEANPGTLDAAKVDVENTTPDFGRTVQGKLSLI